jgi:hypothetical protein
MASGSSRLGWGGGYCQYRRSAPLFSELFKYQPAGGECGVTILQPALYGFVRHRVRPCRLSLTVVR